MRLVFQRNDELQKRPMSCLAPPSFLRMWSLGNNPSRPGDLGPSFLASGICPKVSSRQKKVDWICYKYSYLFWFFWFLSRSCWLFELLFTTECGTAAVYAAGGHSLGLKSGEAHSAPNLAGWGPARPTAIESWQWRSGAAHCDQELAEEVRRGPLRSRAGR